jgi:hypothetical protein
LRQIIHHSRIALLITFLFVGQFCFCQSDYWSYHKEIKEVIEQIDKAVDAIDRIKEVHETLKTKEKAKEVISTWQQIAEQFNTSAQIIQKAKLPSEFNDSKYRIDITEINCENKNRINATLNSFLEELKKTQKAAYYSQQKLNSFLVRLRYAEAAIEATSEIYEKLMLHTAGYELLWDQWKDIQLEVIPALTILKNNSIKYLNKIVAEAKKSALKINNLSGNLALIQAMKCGGIFRSQQLNFPNNVLPGNCQWNFNMRDVSIEIIIDPTEKLVSAGKLLFTQVEEPVNGSRCGSYDTFNYDCPMQKFTVNGSTIYIEFKSSVYRLYFTGTKQKDVINGSLALEPLPQTVAQNGGKSFRIVHNITLNKQ